MSFFESPTAPERFPPLEEIKTKIKEFCGQENPEVVRTLEDEKGVYLYEVATIDKKGDTSLYVYRRAGDFKETKAAETVIDVGYFEGKLEDNMCVGGETLSEYDEATGKWTDTR